jgi:membrane fusion protein, multidrug efflux system
MRKVVMFGLVLAVAGGAAAYFGLFSSGEQAAGLDSGQGAPGGGASGRGGRQPGGGGGGGFGGPGGGNAGPRVPMTVELGAIKKGDLSAHLVVVGNLIGEQTVDIAPKTGGRVERVNVQLGDRVRRGQVLAKIEDREIVEQVRQAVASQSVSKATIRQREADLRVAEVNFDRSKNLFERQLLAKQALDDAESKYLSAVAQLDLSKAQESQTDARLEELRINLQNTSVTSPVDGFVGKRNVDPGAMVSQNAPIASVVDISKLRMVANIVEKDLRMVSVGDSADVEVDAYPGETFRGRIARVAPVLDPSTRTATMEVEVPNVNYKLKPGMYARVNLTVEDRKNILIAPKNAVIDFESKRGVWMPSADNHAQFVPVELGIEDSDQIEIKAGLKEGDKIVTTGAAAVKNNDQLLIAGAEGPGGGAGPGGPGRGGRGGRGRGGENGQGTTGAPSANAQPGSGQPGQSPRGPRPPQ